MPVTGSTLRVEGLSQLTRAFKVIDKEIADDLKNGLRQAAEPVRVDAERLTALTIKRGVVPWYRMRVGVTAASTYVVPARRGRKGRSRSYRRRNFRTLVLPRMIQALRQNETVVRRRAERVIDQSIAKWGRAG